MCACANSDKSVCRFLIGHAVLKTMVPANKRSRYIPRAQQAMTALAVPERLYSRLALMSTLSKRDYSRVWQWRCENVARLYTRMALKGLKLGMGLFEVIEFQSH